MPDAPKKDDQLPDAEADERFDRAIKNALATPPKPHKPHRSEKKERQPPERRP